MLAAYNAWKRGTLDRIAARYRNELLKVYADHLRAHEKEIRRALENEQDQLTLPTDDMDEAIEAVFRRHLKYTVYVGVSAGIREVTPEKRLSTWSAWPAWHPVEDTFVSLAEKKIRNSLFDRIFGRIERDNKHSSFPISKLAEFAKRDYLMTIKTTFRVLSRDYFEDEESKNTPKSIKTFIENTLEVSRGRAETIFRTETTRYFNESRVDYFNDHSDVDFYQINVDIDGRTSAICECRKNYVLPGSFSKEKRFMPPFHPNCRTELKPLISGLKAHDEEIRRNLGSEFGRVKSGNEDTFFAGARQPPSVPLPRGWE